jgi:hypothetical protein
VNASQFFLLTKSALPSLILLYNIPHTPHNTGVIDNLMIILICFMCAPFPTNGCFKTGPSDAKSIYSFCDDRLVITVHENLLEITACWLIEAAKGLFYRHEQHRFLPVVHLQAKEQVNGQDRLDGEIAQITKLLVERQNTQT